MKITASITESSHQDRGPCYLHLPVSFFYIHSPVPQQIRTQTTVQLCILLVYYSMTLGLNMYESQTPHAAYNIHHVSLNT